MPIINRGKNFKKRREYWVVISLWHRHSMLNGNYHWALTDDVNQLRLKVPPFSNPRYMSGPSTSGHHRYLGSLWRIKSYFLLTEKERISRWNWIGCDTLFEIPDRNAACYNSYGFLNINTFTNIYIAPVNREIMPHILQSN